MNFVISITKGYCVASCEVPLVKNQVKGGRKVYKEVLCLVVWFWLIFLMNFVSVILNKATRTKGFSVNDYKKCYESIFYLLWIYFRILNIGVLRILDFRWYLSVRTAEIKTFLYPGSTLTEQ